MSNSLWLIEPFDKNKHISEGFSCGYLQLDEYLIKYASQDIKRRVALIFVATLQTDNIVRGYYTLSAASFAKDNLPVNLAKKLPFYPVPAAIIGRLAVDQTCQGKKLGRYLLMDAFNRILQASNWIAVNAIIVDAKDDKAKEFYLKYGFQSFASQPLRLFIPVTTVAQLVVSH